MLLFLRNIIIIIDRVYNTILRSRKSVLIPIAAIRYSVSSNWKRPEVSGRKKSDTGLVVEKTRQSFSAASFESFGSRR